MIQVLNKKILKDIPFDEYLKLPGYSFSSIKGFSGPPTAKMQLGTDVHNYLLTPEQYDHRNRELVLPIATALRKQLGVLVDKMLPESIVTADFVCNGFKLPYKGRLDLHIPGRLIIDIKVSDVPLSVSCPRFGYDDQQSGYAIGGECKIALLVRISPVSVKKKRPIVEIKNVPITTLWWENQIVQKGEPI